MPPLQRRLLLTLVQQTDKALPRSWFRRFALRGVSGLKRRGLVEVSSTHVSLTPSGVMLARRVKYRSGEEAKEGTTRGGSVKGKHKGD